MEAIAYSKLLNNRLSPITESGKTTGFVPTMGALHEGHASLIRKSVSENDVTIASIFVNPAQFNEKGDLDNYPRMPIEDHNLLVMNKCDFVFEPSIEEMYPGKVEVLDLDLGVLSKVMEGKYRPGHFEGMITIVYKLLKLTNPTRAYFGEKDFQQLAIIRFMVKKMGLKVGIIGCPTIREADGLAMSSRNIRLNPEERAEAPVIFGSMRKFAVRSSSDSIDAIRKKVIESIEKTRLFRVEYFEIVEAETLQPVSDWMERKELRACIAVKASHTRLIDNISVD